jgi:hypothetical protein
MQHLMRHSTVNLTTKTYISSASPPLAEAPALSVAVSRNTRNGRGDRIVPPLGGLCEFRLRPGVAPDMSAATNAIPVSAIFVMCSKCGDTLDDPEHGH